MRGHRTLLLGSAASLAFVVGALLLHAWFWVGIGALVFAVSVFAQPWASAPSRVQPSPAEPLREQPAPSQQSLAQSSARPLATPPSPSPDIVVRFAPSPNPVPTPTDSVIDVASNAPGTEREFPPS